MDSDRFAITIPQDALDDLDRRLRHVRWAADLDNNDWRYGTQANYLQELVAYWRDEYDWRAHESEMNKWVHYRTQVDGVPVHYLRVTGRGPAPAPLILSHGWPWTFWDFQKVLGPLSDPAAYGGSADDAFDLIVPSLPGFGFSAPLTSTGVNFTRTADLWVNLMRQLGYDRFLAHGSDWGALLTAQLGHKYPDRVTAVHLTTPAPLDIFTGGAIPEADYADQPSDLLAARQAFMSQETGYSAIQSTKPQSLAYALNDSPVGLCAWLVEKRRTWSDCGGDVEQRFSKDDLLTTVMLYWLTETAGSAARYYYEAAHQPWHPARPGEPVVVAPTAGLVFSHDIFIPPRRWAQRYYNLKRWNTVERGGHFVAFEEPETLVDDLRAFFRDYR
jgi:pimeloyl-ACP methyl ester carboxylesterase